MVGGAAVVSSKGGEGWIGTGSFGEQFLRARFGGRRVLWDGWLDAFDCQPVGYEIPSLANTTSLVRWVAQDIPVKFMSRGTLGSGALINFSKSTSSSSR